MGDYERLKRSNDLISKQAKQIKELESDIECISCEAKPLLKYMTICEDCYLIKVVGASKIKKLRKDLRLALSIIESYIKSEHINYTDAEYEAYKDLKMRLEGKDERFRPLQ